MCATVRGGGASALPGPALDLLDSARKLARPPPIVVVGPMCVTAARDSLVRGGASDYVPRPHLTVEVLVGFLGAIGARPKLPTLAGESMASLAQTVRLIAAADLPVLIRGETGTGKDVLAEAIHDAGPRRKQPFVALNCGAVPPTLLEGELFGHVRGAFTGAERDRVGVFEQATGGTVFLDEIAEASLTAQAALLRVLEKMVVRPVGAAQERRIDCRVMSASHADLEKRVADGRFREDLFYRLKGFTLRLLPLRERRRDIPAIASSLLATARPPVRIPDDGIAFLVRQRWPGNIRQLRNVLAAAVALSAGRILGVDLLRRCFDDDHAPTAAPEPADLDPCACEILALAPQDPEGAIRAALREVALRRGGSLREAAKILNRDKKTLIRWKKKKAGAG